MAAFSRWLTSSLVLLFVFLSFTEAKEILVGGKADAWKIPSSESDSLNKWAEKSRFRIGDSLVWKYDGGKDSVLQVTKEAYASCITSNPIAEYNDGNTKVKLENSGPFYFISGAKGHCEEGQKLHVVVLSPKHRYTGISPAPSPAEIEGPAIAPTSSATGLKAAPSPAEIEGPAIAPTSSATGLKAADITDPESPVDGEELTSGTGSRRGLLVEMRMKILRKQDEMEAIQEKNEANDHLPGVRSGKECSMKRTLGLPSCIFHLLPYLFKIQALLYIWLEPTKLYSISGWSQLWYKENQEKRKDQKIGNLGSGEQASNLANQQETEKRIEEMREM
ncbi:hypothetical protein DITRI_Ditri03aG0010000 [Diplodiscus trichospermus]